MAAWMRGVTALALVLLALLPAARAAARTIVTLSFDDALISQRQVPGILGEFGLRGSFFIPSGRVDTSGNLTWQEVAAIAADGHEIGGHTLDHVNLTAVSRGEAIRQVCDDRAALVARGFDPVSFAYPFGAADEEAAAIVAECGYGLGRVHGGIRTPTGCSSCPPAESIPPRDLLRLRTVSSVRNTYALPDLQGYVLRAEQGGGGWINFNFHEVLRDCSGETYCIQTDLFRQFLSWLAQREAFDTVILPQGEAFGLLAEPDEQPPAVALTTPDAGALVGGDVLLQAAAIDDVGVVRVDFLVDGEVVGSDASEPFEISWDSTEVADGTISLRARAVDAAGNVGVSAEVRVDVENTSSDTIPPQVALTAPAAGQQVSGTVTLAASASDDVGVVRVDFLVDGEVVGSDATAPFAIAWDSSTAGSGSASVQARAVDAAGNVGLSAPRTITVLATPSLVKLPFGSTWRYHSSWSSPGANWYAADYDDRFWASGAGQLGYGEGDEATRIPAGSFFTFPSTYFRRTVELPGRALSARITILHDDGFVLILNGRLVAYRHVHSLDHMSFATRAVENQRSTFTIPASYFVPGENQIAVVVKQQSPFDDDLSFDLELEVEVAAPSAAHAR